MYIYIQELGLDYILFMCRKFHFLNKVRLYSSYSFLYEDNLNLLNKLESFNNINPDFCSYLAGLIEGDGSIIVPKTERSIKGKLNYPSIQLVFDLRDFPLALILQQILRHGSLSSPLASLRGEGSLILNYHP